MRVMIDGYNLGFPQGTGVATYGFALAQAIREAGWGVEGLYGLRAPFNPKLRDIMFYESLGREHETRRPRIGGFSWSREIKWGFSGRRPRAIATDGAVVTEGFANRLPKFDRLMTVPDLFDQSTRLFRQLGMFQDVKVANPPDIMHWTYPVPVHLRGARNIYTLHDLVPLKMPYASLDNKRHYYKLVRSCIRRSDAICTISEASARDIVDLFPEAEGKLFNTFQSVDFPPHMQADSEAELTAILKSIFNLTYRGYFLYFGAIEPKKNVARLLEGYLSLDTKTPLVIVGKRAWGADKELQLLQPDELQPLKAMFRNVRRIDYLPRTMLVRLIRGAKAVAFPSVYEGFGLPVLEAMKLGAPVLTSNTSSLPEVAGDGALYVDPYKPAEIREAFRRLDTDADLRETLRARGKERAEFFSMVNYQDRLNVMYSAVLNGSKG